MIIEELQVKLDATGDLGKRLTELEQQLNKLKKGADNTEKATENLGKTKKKTAKETETLKGRFGDLANASGLLSGRLGGAANSALGFADEAMSLAGTLGPMLPLVVGLTAAVAAFGAVLSNAAEDAEQFQTEVIDQARALQLTTEEYLNLAGAARQVHISQDQLFDSIKDLNERLAETGELGSGSAAEGLKLLNLEVSDFDGLTVTEQLLLISDSMGGLERDSAKLTAAVQLLNGEVAGPFVEALGEGGDALREALEMQQMLGNELSIGFKGAVDDYTKASGDLDQVTTNVSRGISTWFLPVLTTVKEAITDFIVENKELIGQDLPGFIFRLGDISRAAARPVVAMADLLSGPLPSGADDSSNALTGLNAILDITIGLFDRTSEAIEDAGDELNRTFGFIEEWLGKGTPQRLGSEFGSIGDVISRGIAGNVLLSAEVLRNSLVEEGVIDAPEEAREDPKRRDPVDPTARGDLARTRALDVEISEAENRLRVGVAREQVTGMGAALEEARISQLRAERALFDPAGGTEEERQILSAQVERDAAAAFDVAIANLDKQAREDAIKQREKDKAEFDRRKAESDRDRQRILQQIPGFDIIDPIIDQLVAEERRRLRFEGTDLSDFALQERLNQFAEAQRRSREEILSGVGGSRALRAEALQRGIPLPGQDMSLQQELVAGLRAETGDELAQLSGRLLPVTAVRPTVVVTQNDIDLNLEQSNTFTGIVDAEALAREIRMQTEAALRTMISSAARQSTQVVKR